MSKEKKAPKRRMLWAQRGNPDNNGVGMEVRDASRASRICRESNELFPAYKHWHEEEEELNQQQTQE